MLWHKSWMEVRFRFVLTILLAAYVIYVVLSVVPPEVQAKFPTLAPASLGAKIWKVFLIAFGFGVLPVSAKILAGAGINAQTSMGMSRGFHGSMSFLLSMPISRFEILATRAGIGAILMLLLAVATFLSLQLLAPLAHVDLQQVAVWAALPNVFLVSTLFYCLAVWLTTFLDEFWSGTIGLLILGAFGGFSLSIPATIFDLSSYLLSPSPLLPIGQTLALIFASFAMLFAALWVIEKKEY